MTNRRQQPAVELLFQEMLEIQRSGNTLTFDEHLALLEKYQAIHKEQIKESWNHGFDWGMMEQSLAEQGAESTLIDAEHYYTETFNTNEE